MHENSLTLSQRCLGTYLWEEHDEDDLSDYAIRYWPAHVEELGYSSQRAMIRPTLIEFFTQEEHFEDWLEKLEAQPNDKIPSWNNTLERKLDAVISSPPSPLFTICCFGFIEVLEHPGVGHMLDVNQMNRRDTSGLYLAARRGHMGVVRKLLDLGVDPNAPGYQYGTALQAASFGGHQAIVKLLLDRCASTALTDKGEFSSALQAALANGNNPVAKVLLDAGFHLYTQKQFDDALETATFRGNVEMVEQLLRGGTGTFALSFRPDPLQVALFRGKTRQAKQLLKDCSDINEDTGWSFGNALAAAIASRKLELVKLVIHAGAQLDLRGRFGFPLHAAVISGQLDIVRYLLKNGADPNIKDTSLGDPLQAAASTGNLDIMLILLVHNASVSGYGGYFSDTLQAASFSGHEQAVRLLIDHGAKVDNALKSERGRYGGALQAAVYAGHDNIVRILLGAGASVSSRHIARRNQVVCERASRSRRAALPDSRALIKQLDISAAQGPLEMAARQGNVALISMLLARGAKVDGEERDTDESDDELSNKSAFTALQVAAFWGRHAVVECLLHDGANINAVQKTLGTPLQAALQGGRLEIADMLLARSAEIDMHWGLFGSCLQVFSERGDLRAVKFLLDRGADIEDPGGEYGNALQVACEAGHVPIVEFLLDKGADAKAPGKSCGNALQAASANGHLSIVKLLLCHSVHVDDANGGNETPLCAAAENGHEEVTRLLLQNGANVDGIASLPENQEKSRVFPDRSFPVPLHRSAYYGHESVASMLLKRGANVHRQGTINLDGPSRRYQRQLSEYPNTPLEAACAGESVPVVRLLFSHDPFGYIYHTTFAHALNMGLKNKTYDIPVTLVREGFRKGFKQCLFESVFTNPCEDDWGDGYIRTIKEILRYFPKICSPDHLLQAAISGNAEAVHVLLEAGVNPNIRDQDGKSVLYLTVDATRRPGGHWFKMRQPWIEIVKVLVDAGADMKCLSSEMRQGFVRKVFESGKVEVLETLDCHECHLFNGAAEYSETLIAASKKGRATIIRFICTKRVPTASEAKAAMAAAIEARKAQPEIIKSLLFSGAPLSFDEDEPLTTASRQGWTEIVAPLVQHATYSTAIIERALESAVRGRHVACAQAILESQPQERIDRRTTCTRLAQICPPFRSGDVLSYLLSQGVDPDLRDPKSGGTLLYKATFCGDNDTVKALLSHNANPFLVGGKHGTALHLAGMIGSVDAIELFLSLGVDINKRSGRFGTPLAAVMAQKWIECSRCIDDHPCPTWSFKQMLTRQTDFHEAVEEFGDDPAIGCHRCCAELLLDWDADIDTISGESGTALQVANDVGNIEGVEMMLRKRDMDSNMAHECVNSPDISDSE